MTTNTIRQISHNHVDLWWEDLDGLRLEIFEMWKLLTREERTRAQRFRQKRHRHRFIVRHGMLRKILSGYLNIDPREVRLACGSGGKPYVPGNHHLIRFNLSDSGGHALYAVACGREVGVDMERVRSKPSAAALVKRFFSAKETAAFEAMDVGERTNAFFAGWTRKEAYVKAIGTGLRFSLERFDVSLEPGDQNALLEVTGAPLEVRRWSLRDIDLGSDFRAAVAVEMKREENFNDIFIRFRGDRP